VARSGGGKGGVAERAVQDDCRADYIGAIR
jgi:hypothetical protein